MQLFCILVSSLVALASANPLPDSSSRQTTKCSATITATYDDLPASPPAATPIPIGPYLGLKYNSINLITQGVLGTPPPAGLIYPSKPNAFSVGRFTILSTPNVTVLGGGAGYKIFNPTHIAYSCVIASEETSISVPTSCTIALSGYKADVRVVRQLVTYEVTNGQLTKAMSVASLQGFNGVDTVKFEIVVPEAAKLTLAAVFDNFMYTGCS